MIERVERLQESIKDIKYQKYKYRNYISDNENTFCTCDYCRIIRKCLTIIDYYNGKTRKQQ